MCALKVLPKVSRISLFAPPFRKNVQHVAFRYLGPRKDLGGTYVKEQVGGRYGLHFHHCNDGSDGSIVEGCVMRDIDNHAYVPHVSHGITMHHNIAFNCTEATFLVGPARCYSPYRMDA